jgi:hypothetical protein
MSKVAVAIEFKMQSRNLCGDSEEKCKERLRTVRAPTEIRNLCLSNTSQKLHRVTDLTVYPVVLCLLNRTRILQTKNKNAVHTHTGIGEMRTLLYEEQTSYLRYKPEGRVFNFRWRL